MTVWVRNHPNNMSWLNIKKKGTSPYHPCRNGMVGRFNRTLKGQLAKLIHQNGGEWDHYLPAVVLSFNSTPRSSTGYSPIFLCMVESLMFQLVWLSLRRWCHGRHRTMTQNWWNGWTQFIGLCTLIVRSRDKNVSTTWTNMKFKPYQCGDLVWIDDPTT